jgi:nitroreductase
MPEDIHRIDLFEIMRTTRSMRQLKPDPIPDELIRKILEAGVCAPSGGNMQKWRFLVIKDAPIKQTVGAFYKRAWDKVVAPRYRAGEPAPGTSRERLLRMLDAAEYLAAHVHEAPVWIVPCLERANPTRTAGSSIYPAVQNILLAARALGFGATLTTLYLTFEKEVEGALGLPTDWHSYAIIPIGYPMGRFGPARRACSSRFAVAARNSAFQCATPAPASGPTRCLQIFRAFQRANDSRPDGLGLGLFIVKHAADLLGHRVEVRSAEGRGSCFTIVATPARYSAQRSAHLTAISWRGEPCATYGS